MTEARRLTTLAFCLALIVAGIGWQSLGERNVRCLFAVTDMTGGKQVSGYLEVPCGLTSEQLMKYLRDHPDDILRGSPFSN